MATWIFLQDLAQVDTPRHNRCSSPMALFTSSLLLGLMIILVRLFLLRRVPVSQTRIVSLLATLASTACVATAILSFPSALTRPQDPARPLDIERVALSLSPKAPYELGSGLVLESVIPSGSSKLIFKCTMPQSHMESLPGILEELQSSLDRSAPTRRLVDMGISLTYQVTTLDGIVLGEVTTPSPRK